MILMAFAALWMFAATAMADELSGDNSLYSLGIENGECSPEFYYSTLEYNVTVPAGTTELNLSPVTSDSNATILDISGTQLDENGNGTVYITVEAPNGAQVTYTLNVTSDGEAAAAETETEDAAAAEAAKEEELRKQAESEEALRQEAANKANEEKVSKLTAENNDLTERLDLLMKVLYGLIAFAVILLFFIINQSLRNKDLKDDLKEARSQVDLNNEFARKEQNMRSDYYYAPVQGRNQAGNQGMNQIMANGQGVPMADASQNTQAAFGNASQRLQAQPMPGQASAPAQQGQPVMTQEKPMSKREQKKQEKAAKKAEKQAQPAVPVQETVVKSSMEEPEVNVDMIDL